ncbi:hypothetical protein [Streptomyces colonosanans]|uniref:Secreted protein n=1 Tax=Streptomyces colonosanans TaxID=1428652 RepID=A0A1S2P7L5_9ACTN|nr:hypothetical protein [Streptomyces colonosanans]OIJ89681.1 hypothetical protein BIV24_18820 [Streptomyces colonosanans]
MLPPSVIAGVSIVCAVGPWLFAEPLLLRGLAAGAAVTTAVGAFVMRRWDVAAGKRVADLMRARASDEWRHEERVAELESDLEESRELRTKLEHKLRAKRTELAKLRNEHAALLRRYATAETERASALEGRRLLAIETAAPVRALPPVRGADVRDLGDVASSAADGPEKDAGSEPSAPRVFSAEGSSLFARADSALARLAGRDSGAVREQGAQAEDDATEANASAQDGDTGEDDALETPASPEATAPGHEAQAAPVRESGSGEEGEGEEKHTAVAVREHASAPAATQQSVTRPVHGSGHFTVPTAAAVVQPVPRWRPAVQGGFDFFGTRTSGEALGAVQNEDLADVVGQEALAVHKAESESGLQPVDPQAHAVGEVIDLTAHDETEQIDVQGLRTAAS